MHIYKFLSLKLPLGLVCYLAHNMHKNKNIAMFYIYTGRVFFFRSCTYMCMFLVFLYLFDCTWS